MKHNKTILIIDDDAEYAKDLAAYASNHGFFQASAYAADGEEGFSVLQLTEPNVIILDTLMPRLDGIGFLRRLKNEYSGDKPIIIMVSEASLQGMMQAAAGYGVDYFMLKPQRFESICETARDLSEDCDRSAVSRQEPEDSLEENVTVFLRSLGFSANHNGYRYMRSAIMMTMNDFSVLSPITQRLYPSLAQMYNTSKYSVERSLRHAISKSWDRGNKKLLSDIFGYSADNSNLSRPTNSEYIAMAADDFRLRLKHDAL